MGLKLNINNILRQDITEELQVGTEYSFEKEGHHLIADNIHIWLTQTDWTVLADIQVTSQQRKNGKTTGTFEIKHLYKGDEQRILTDIFRRMYG